MEVPERDCRKIQRKKSTKQLYKTKFPERNYLQVQRAQ